MNKSFLLLVLLICFNCSENVSEETPAFVNVIPQPKEVIFSNNFLTLKSGFRIVSNDTKVLKLQQVLNDFQEPSVNTDKLIAIEAIILNNLKSEAHEINISTSSITIKGGSYKALVHACMTLVQLSKNEKQIRTGTIKDSPQYGYRSVMLDLSRNWHDLTSIKQVIALASFYKINYLQLHLTDDALFTFPSKAFPKLASKQSYTLNDLKALNEYADIKGVTLIPEVDVPGHSSGFIRAMPELFGLDDVFSNPYTLNMGKEEVYEALDILFGEVAEAFPNSPFIHLGGDEVFTEGFTEDQHVKAYLENNKLRDVDALYRHFLVRIAEIIKSKGKKPMLWSGFEREGSVKISKDIIIMNWKPGSYAPNQMLGDGYQIINASWQPLYVVNNRKWTPKTIYNWSPLEWKGFATPEDIEPLKATNKDNVLGASMSVWEQNQYKIFSSLKERLPAMAEKIWSHKISDFSNFEERVFSTNKIIDDVIFPFQLLEEGLTFSKDIEPNFREDMWFQDSLKVSLKPLHNGTSMYYTLDGSLPTIEDRLYSESIIISDKTRLSIRAFKNKKPIGLTLLKDYSLMPIKFDITGLANNLQPNSWERHKFLDSITVTLNSKILGNIRYTTDNSAPTRTSLLYKKPFTVKTSGLLRAKLFDKNGEQIGEERREEYEQLIKETSLTTGKNVETSNTFESGVPAVITNGEISRWDHWGAHTDGNNWVIVDLEKEQEIHAFKVYTFWDNYRYYEYTIEASSDKKNWKMLVNRSQNRALSTPQGQLDSIVPTKARFLKLNLIRNSANPGLHLVEFQAF